MARTPNLFEPVIAIGMRRPAPLRRGGTLAWGQHILSIESDLLMIGRDASCDVVLEDALVSRKHARFVVSDSRVLIEDLYSTNGVFVNEVRIDRDHVLVDGDRIVLGMHEFLVFANTPTNGLRAARTGSEAERVQTPQPTTLPTRRAGLFSTVGPVIEGMVQERRVADAARLLDDSLSRVLHGLRMGLRVPDEAIDAGSSLALLLATASGDGRWIDRVVALHQRARRAMSTAVIDALTKAMPMVADYDVVLLRLYFERFPTMEHALFDCQHL